MKTLTEKLGHIQVELHAPKNLTNSFGKYNYRNLESILKAIKPLLETTKCAITITDDIVRIGDRNYVKSVACISDGDTNICTTGFAWEEPRKGMDSAQVTGACSSYARKYAMNGLFSIDNTDDADTQNNKTINHVTKAQKDQSAAILDRCKETGDLKKANEVYERASNNNPPVEILMQKYVNLFGEYKDNIFKRPTTFIVKAPTATQQRNALIVKAKADLDVAKENGDLEAATNIYEEAKDDDLLQVMDYHARLFEGGSV